MSAAVEVRGLSKDFGAVHALRGVDLTVEQGSIFGFLGPNGAGKTTTLRILTGLARPTAGTVTILGADATVATNAVRARMGFLPDVPGFYEWMTAPEFLRFAGGLFNLGGDALEERISVLLDLAGLTGVDTRVGGFSRGMKQRLGVAQALVNAPELLLLDEPTSALDPMGRKELLDMLASLRGRTTVLFSTHILADVERICDTVAILDKGKVVAQAPIDELRAHYGASKVLVEVTEGAEAFAEALRAEPWAGEVEREDNGTIEVKVTDDAAAQRRIPQMVVERGLGLKRLEAGELGLEEVFVELVGGESR
ncbi:MAG TPA: ABC transporter ATP-binding protein [Coriobacteriia bacterium]